MNVGGQGHSPSALPFGKRLVPNGQEAGWGPTAGRDRCGKSRSPPGFDPRTVQLVASRYTDAIVSTYPMRRDDYKIKFMIRRLCS